MVGIKNAKNRTTQVKQERNISNAENRSGILGGTSEACRGVGDDAIAASGEDSELRDTVSLGKQPSDGIGGKILRQLISSTEQQLAYHKTQASELEAKLQDLHQLSQKMQNPE